MRWDNYHELYVSICLYMSHYVSIYIYRERERKKQNGLIFMECLIAKINDYPIDPNGLWVPRHENINDKYTSKD